MKGLLVLVLLVAAPVAALAADGSSVTFDLGAIVSPLVQVAATVLLGVATFALSKAPAVVQSVLTEQLLGRAMAYAVATVQGAAAGKEVTIPVANELLRTAAQYAADNAPKLTKALADTLGPKLIARLGDVVQLPADASAADLDHVAAPL